MKEKAPSNEERIILKEKKWNKENEGNRRIKEKT